LPGNPYDGHTLGVVIEDTERLTGCEIERAYVDKGYWGHRAANPRHVFISGQKRGVFGVIKRELRRRCTVEAVIGHMKTDGHLGRCHLKDRQGDAANVILTAVGHNLRLVLAWLRALCRLIVLALLQAFATPSARRSASTEKLRKAKLSGCFSYQRIRAPRLATLNWRLFPQLVAHGSAARLGSE
jgi:transposase, IS5 family